MTATDRDRHEPPILTTARAPVATTSDWAGAGTGDPETEVSLWWLGQAGFLLRSAGAAVVVDPYLSDSLARKYSGREFAHTRMMPPPILPHQLQEITHVLCTHGHSDHLDPGSIPEIAAASPDAIFVTPTAVSSLAIERGVPADRLVSMDAGEVKLLPAGKAAAAERPTGGVGNPDPGGRKPATGESIPPQLEIHAVASAHEDIRTDADGRHLYLGYLFELGGVRFYHSGDTVPYPGLARKLRDVGVDVALLPVNGRDEYRRERGVPGNLTLSESVALATEIEASYLICHHWGMFNFNTIDPDTARGELARILPPGAGVQALLPEIGTSYTWSRAR